MMNGKSIDPSIFYWFLMGECSQNKKQNQAIPLNSNYI
jgi:hypothetical protein